MDGFLNPTEILKKLELNKNMVAADFGCGSGGWVIPLSKILENGKIYAIDILEEPLSALNSKIKAQKLFNIEIVRGDVERGTRLLRESCDLVLMTNLLFECENKRKVLEEGKRVLRKGGEILIVDWTPISQPLAGSPIGPAPKERVSPEEIKKLAKDIGLKLKEEFKAGPYHYGLLFSK